MSMTVAMLVPEAAKVDVSSHSRGQQSIVRVDATIKYCYCYTTTTTSRLLVAALYVHESIYIWAPAIRMLSSRLICGTADAITTIVNTAAANLAATVL